MNDLHMLAEANYMIKKRGKKLELYDHDVVASVGDEFGYGRWWLWLRKCIIASLPMCSLG